MKRNEAFPSKFLKAADLVNDKGQSIAKRVTCSAIEDITYKDDDKTQRLISFKETDKKLGLNMTNWDDLARISGQDPEDPDCDDEKFVGQKFEVYRAFVKYGNDTVPAVRLRPIGGWPQPVVEDEPAAAEEGADDGSVPF